MRGMIVNGLIWCFADRSDDEVADRWSNPEAIGILPSFLSADDPRSAREQFDANYQWGGNWRSEPHGLLSDGSMTYPGDPPLPWVAMTRLRDETVLIYPFAFVAIVSPDGSFVIERMD